MELTIYNITTNIENGLCYLLHPTSITWPILFVLAELHVVRNGHHDSRSKQNFWGSRLHPYDSCNHLKLCQNKVKKWKKMSIYLKKMSIALKLLNFISENVVYLHTTRFLGKPGHMTKIPKRGCSLGIPWRHQWRGFPKNPPTTSPETKIQRHPPKSAIDAAHASRDNRS